MWRRSAPPAFRSSLPRASCVPARRAEPAQNLPSALLRFAHGHKTNVGTLTTAPTALGARRRLATALVSIALAALLLSATGASANRPNLVQKPLAEFLEQSPPAGPQIVQAVGGRNDLAFSSGILNRQGVGSVSPGTLVLTGSRPDTTVNTMSAIQNVDGTQILAGAFQYNVAVSHQHWHLLNLDRYQLRAHDAANAVLGVDQKTGFCLAATLNGNCAEDTPDALSVDESLNAGGSDIYSPERDGQYIDVTGFAPGFYELVQWANSDCSLLETTPDDNAQAMVVELVAGDPPTVVAHPEMTPYFDAWWASHPHCLPHETVRPQISGSPAVGAQLRASPGSWLNRLATGFGYQWRRCAPAGAGCADISGATAPSYVPTPGDVGYTLRARVAATEGLDIEQLTPQDSDATAAVAAEWSSTAAPAGSHSSAAPGPAKAAPLRASARFRSRITPGTLLNHGVVFKVHCSEACNVHTRLVASVHGRLGHRVVLVLAVADLRLSRAGTVTGHLRVSHKLRARLRQAKLHGLTLRITVRGGDGQQRGIVRRIRVIG